MRTKIFNPAAGMTLLELIVVLVIAGMVTALVLPRFSRSLYRLDLKTSAQKTSSVLRYARSQAVSEQITHYVVFDFEKNGCIVQTELPGTDDDFHSETETTELETADGLRVEVITVQSYFLPETVKIEKAALNDKEIDSGVYAVEFYPAGNSSGGTIVLMDEKKRRMNITVDFITGMVDIADPDVSEP